MKKIFTLTVFACATLMFACSPKVQTAEVQGVVIDASMNNILVKTANGDTVSISTMNANPVDVAGVLLADSISVAYKDSAEVKTATKLVVLKQSPYGLIQGVWLEPNPINANQKQGFELNQTGAKSVNMATLNVINWTLNLDPTTLILNGQSIGNGQTIDFCDTLNVVKLDKDSLVLASHGVVVYKLARN